jgi:hypothetical protein
MGYNVAIVDLFYLPPIEFFVAIEEVDTLWIEAHDNYQKQSYRNRSALQMANKVELLSIPVMGGNGKLKYREVLMDDGQRWRDTHLRGIKSAYGKAPFFEYFYPEFEKVFLENITHLYAFNYRLLTICLNLLGRSVKMEETLEYQAYEDKIDLRGVISTKASYTERNIYDPFPYMQLFGLNFAPNLSIVDLLFCEGPNSKNIINNSKKEFEHSLKGLRF